MPHLDEGTLHALLDGEIPSTELPPIQAHLGACAECRARLAEEQELLAESDRLIEVLELPEAAPARAPIRPAPRRVWPARLAWAATVVLAAGLGYSARGGPIESGPRPSRDSGAELRADQPVVSRAPAAPEPVNQSRDQASAPKLGAAPPPTDPRTGKAAAGNTAPVEAKAELRVAAVDSAAPPPAPSPVQPPNRPAAPGASLGRVGALRQEEARVREIAPAGALADRAAFAVAQPVTLPEAMRVLGGSLRLIDGMIPERLETLGNSVRVVYRTGFGELLLSQELLDGRLRFTLIPPRGFPADSLGRAAYLAAHLLNTFLLLAALGLTAHWSARPAPAREPRRGGTAPWLLALGLVAILVLGMTGAIAALGDTLFPSRSLADGLRADGDPAAHFLVRLRVFHPVLAILGGIYLSGMVWAVARARPAALESRWGRAVTLLVLLQLVVGLTNLFLLAPTLVQLVHLLVADLLWIATVIFATDALG